MKKRHGGDIDYGRGCCGWGTERQGSDRDYAVDWGRRDMEMMEVVEEDSVDRGKEIHALT